MAAVLALVAAGSVLIAPPAVAGVVINVPSQRSTIQAGIEAASDGDTVLVAPGTYVENINFKGKAIEVKSSAGPATTTIDGDGAGIVATFKANETRASVLRGFTVTHGLQPPIESDIVGGGITVQGASPTIVGNVVTANKGSGIGVLSGSPLIQDNVITANTTLYDGGGIWAGNTSEIVGNRIEDNVAEVAGGLVIFGTTLVKNNIIRGNRTLGRPGPGGGGGGGGGLVVYGGAVVGNVIAGNTTERDDSRGGGLLIFNNEHVHVLQNTFAGNTSPNGSAIAGVSVGTSPATSCQAHQAPAW